ncbi:MAG: MarR family winged helix-turn-helix transcriptional regulator [Alphaproteobacteria bacterium]|tara:strand:+ start:455 stop:865 length:411 start_codon:yes stop_codon:yes gene_type:complete
MKKLIKVKELEQCTCFNLRKMARELTNSYNTSLKSYGVNSTQIPILALLNIYNQIETSKIAELLNLEKSTVRRNSSILIKNKLIRIVKRSANGNLLKLTNNGYNKLKETLPIWKKSNQTGKKLVKSYLGVLKNISK